MFSLKSVREYLNKGYSIEAKGREIAYLRDEVIGDKDYRWLSEMKEWHVEMGYKLRHLKATPIIDIIDPLITACDYGEFTSNFLKSRVLRESSRRPRKSRLFDLFGEYDTKELRTLLKNYDLQQSRVTKKSGLWLLDKIPLEEYTYSALINDFTSCFHQMLNFLSKIFEVMVELAEGRIFVAERNEYLEKLCLEWWEACKMLERNALYSQGDFKELRAVIRGDKCELRVGSAIGHATHVEKVASGIRAYYYDNDEAVHVVFMKLCKHYNVEILNHIEYEVTVIEAEHFNKKDKKFFVGILPFTTSMDLRLAQTVTWYSSSWSSLYYNLMESCSKGKLKPIDVEFEMCKRASIDLLKEIK